MAVWKGKMCALNASLDRFTKAACLVSVARSAHYTLYIGRNFKTGFKLHYIHIYKILKTDFKLLGIAAHETPMIWGVRVE